MSTASMGLVPTVRIKSDTAPGGFMVINKSDFSADRHELHTGEALAPPPLLPPVPSGPKVPDALANLPKDWKNAKTASLRELVQKVTGRTPETREQAIEMIEAALTGKV